MSLVHSSFYWLLCIQMSVLTFHHTYEQARILHCHYTEDALLPYSPSTTNLSVTLLAATASAKSLQSCLILCDPTDSSPSGFPSCLDSPGKNTGVGSISFSNAWKWKVKVKPLSHIWLLATPWTAAFQAPPSMEFSRQEYWNGLPLPSPKIV